MLVEKTFDTGELTLNYAEGSEAGPPLVLLHGLTSGWKAWSVMIPALTPSWHVYALDLRGHGSSGRALNRQYRVVDYARDVSALLQHVGEPVALMGHSLGALTGIATAASAPAGVRALILLNPPLYIRNLDVSAVAGTKEWFTFVYETMKASPSYDEVVGSCRAMLPPGTDETTLRRMADVVYRVAPGTVEVALNNQMFDGMELASTIQRITSPTLLLQADWDHGGAMRDEDAEFFRSNLPSAQVVKIPNVGHGFAAEQPEIVLREMNAFLKPA